MPQIDPSLYKELPKLPGVYRFYDAKQTLLYVGKAKVLKKRVSDYFEGRGHGPRIKNMVQYIHKVDFTLTASEHDALLLEQNLIQTLKPKYNIIFRDDKSYTYLGLTKHDFPQLALFRAKSNDKSKPKQDVEHFGPFTDYYVAKKTLEWLQKTFQLRTCEDSVFSNRSRPCVLGQMKRCSAPCVNEISAPAYQTSVTNAKAVLLGKSKEVVSSLTNQMNEAASKLEFELAAQLRNQVQFLSEAQQQHSFIQSQGSEAVDVIAPAIYESEALIHVLNIKNSSVVGSSTHNFKLQEADTREIMEAFTSHYYQSHPIPSYVIMPVQLEIESVGIELNTKLPQQLNAQQHSWLDLATNNANAALTQRIGKLKLAQERQKDLEALLGKTKLNHIECFDISHFQAEGAVASCVVYKNFSMQPSEYRIFNIAPEHAGDDFASMKEALIRRYQNLHPDEFPQLILIDGGIGQLHKAQEALALIEVNVPMLGIAKGVERKAGKEVLIPSWAEEDQISPGLHSAALQLLQVVRDESHRFAITRNRKKIQKARVTSSIHEVPGIGAAKRQALILAFGSFQKLKEAQIQDIQKVPGIGPKLAEKIHAHLHSGVDG